MKDLLLIGVLVPSEDAYLSACFVPSGVITSDNLYQHMKVIADEGAAFYSKPKIWLAMPVVINDQDSIEWEYWEISSHDTIEGDLSISQYASLKASGIKAFFKGIEIEGT
jgi:hypothetical protein